MSWNVSQTPFDLDPSEHALTVMSVSGPGVRPDWPSTRTKNCGAANATARGGCVRDGTSSSTVQLSTSDGWAPATVVWPVLTARSGRRRNF